MPHSSKNGYWQQVTASDEPAMMDTTASGKPATMGTQDCNYTNLCYTRPLVACILFWRFMVSKHARIHKPCDVPTASHAALRTTGSIPSDLDRKPRTNLHPGTNARCIVSDSTCQFWLADLRLTLGVSVRLLSTPQSQVCLL